jgi:hypothetical protein
VAEIVERGDATGSAAGRVPLSGTIVPVPPPRFDRPIRIRDARGRRVAPIDPAALLLLRRFDAIEEAALRDIVDEIGPGVDKWPRRAAIIGVIGITLAFTVFAVDSIHAAVTTRSLPLDRLLPQLPIFIGVSAGLWFLWFTAKQVRDGKVRAVVLRHRRCPACGYDLRDLPPDDEDDATVCPECGCAWDLGAGRAAEETETAEGARGKDDS